MLHGPKRTQQRARELRRQMTLPELMLWRALQQRPDHMRFRKQHPAGEYVLDFYCPRWRLAVEVDGEAHNRGDRPRRDDVRDAWLASHNVRVLRIAASDVLSNLDGVIQHITNHRLA